MLNLERLIVFPCNDLAATQLLRRVSAEVCHHLLNLVGTSLARANHVDCELLAEAIFSINLHQEVVESLALILSPSSNLANQADRSRSILIANLVVWQESERLFATTNIILLTLRNSNFASNPLEACIAVAKLHVVLLGHLGNNLGSNDSLNEEVGRLKLAELLLVFDDVVAEHHGSLVAVDDHPLALVVTANDSQTVGIRVGSHHEVGIKLSTELHTESHSLSILRVWRNYGWEVAIDNHLLRHHVDVLESP